MATHGKKYEEAAKLIDRNKRYSADEACALVGKTAKKKFDETVDVAIRLGVDPKHADQMVRGTVILPHGLGGKAKKVLVIASGEKLKEGQDAGADHVGGDDMVKKIQEENWLDFDAIVATPDMMKSVGKLGKVLGPRGLMPNPKTGTVTQDVGKAVSDFKAASSVARSFQSKSLGRIRSSGAFSPRVYSKVWAMSAWKPRVLGRFTASSSFTISFQLCMPPQQISPSAASRSPKLSATSQAPAEARHTVAAGWNPSAGQAADAPVQLSATSQTPAEARQTVAAGWNPSAGQVVLEPVQFSTSSHGPAAARHTTPEFPAGCWQLLLLPSH